MLFSGRAQLSDINTKRKNTYILSVRVTKFPGELIDESLKWNNHIRRVKSKLSISVGIIYIFNKVLNRYSMYMLYFTLLSPFLLNCVEIWGNTYPKNVALHKYVTKEYNTADA